MSVQIQIHQGPLEAATPLPNPGGGAVVCFDGIVRPVEDGKFISGLNYQVYELMAQKQLQKLAHQAVTQFHLLAIAIEHSKGFVPSHQCSFRMQVASLHRKEALTAMDWFIDQLKCDVPIWKQPVTMDM